MSTLHHDDCPFHGYTVFVDGRCTECHDDEDEFSPDEGEEDEEEED